jgi:hypothetical protein
MISLFVLIVRIIEKLLGYEFTWTLGVQKINCGALIKTMGIEPSQFPDNSHTDLTLLTIHTRL